MRVKQKNHHTVDLLFVLGLFAAFALSAFLLVLVGAGVYRKTVADSNENFTVRTASAYLAEKIREAGLQAESCPPAASIVQFGDADALVLSQTVAAAQDTEAEAAKVCNTYLYLYDGSLRELYCLENADVGPEAGSRILPLRQFRVTNPSGSLFRFLLEDEEGHSLSFLVNTRAG